MQDGPWISVGPHHKLAHYRTIGFLVRTGMVPVCALGLGEQFTLAIEAAVEALKEKKTLRFPVIYWEPASREFRAALYRIIFELQENPIVVISCLHTRREPRRWQSP